MRIQQLAMAIKECSGYNHERWMEDKGGTVFPPLTCLSLVLFLAPMGIVQLMGTQ